MKSIGKRTTALLLAGIMAVALTPGFGAGFVYADEAACSVAATESAGSPATDEVSSESQLEAVIAGEQPKESAVSETAEGSAVSAAEKTAGEPAEDAEDIVAQEAAGADAPFVIKEIKDRTFTGERIKPKVTVVVPAGQDGDADGDSGAGQVGGSGAGQDGGSGAGQDGANGAGQDSGAAQNSEANDAGETVLEEGVDYTVAYKNNLNAGKATVVVTGIGDYAGKDGEKAPTATATFTIKQAAVSKLTFPAISSKAYTGKAIKPAFTAKYNGKKYKSTNTKCFKVTYSSNVKRGTAQITITGKGNFTGKKTLTFKITRRALSTVKTPKIKDKVYSGKAKKPAFTLKYGGKKLVKGKDYTVKYSNNTKIGKAKITITGKGNFKGTKTVYFKITPKAPKVTRPWATTGAVSLKWGKVSKATHYDVYRSVDGGKTYRKIKTTTKTSYVSRGLKKGKTYKYYVKARYKKGSVNVAGPRSNVVSQKTMMVAISKSELKKLPNKAPASSKLKTFNTDYQLSKTPEGKALLSYVGSLQKSYKVSILVIDLTTGQGFACSPDRTMYAASCLKGPFVALINRDYPDRANKYKGLERDTVVYSDNLDYFTLWTLFDGYSLMRRNTNSLGIHSWDGTRCPYIKPKDLGKLWIEAYWYFYKSTNKNSVATRNLYTHGTQSFLYQGLKGRWTVNAKPGWIAGYGYRAQNDAGIVKAKVKGSPAPYLVVVMTDAYGQHAKLRKLVRLIDDVHTDMMK